MTATITGQIAVDNNYMDPTSTWLHFGGSTTNNIPGIQFQITNTDTTGFYFFVQTGTAIRTHTYLNVKKAPETNTFGPGLDCNPTNWIYPFFISTNATSDSPGALCHPRYNSVGITDSFNMYLMYSNFSSEAMPVPLKVVNWNWSANATNTATIGVPHWVINGTAWVMKLPATNTSSSPQWTTNLIEHMHI
jgi:hypothetical protein